MDSKEKTAEHFKVCPCCGKVWDVRASFLDDPSVRIIGYQIHPQDLELGMFLFNHIECGTTMSIRVNALSDLYPGPVFAQNLMGTDKCPEYCLRERELSPCPAQCECAYVRDIIQSLKGESSTP